MAKEPDIVDRLAVDLPNPRVVGEIDQALERNAQERIDLLDLRKLAVRRHGEPGAAPAGAPLTVASLIAKYKTDEGSGYRLLRFKTRENYDSNLRRIEGDIGPIEIRHLDGEKLSDIYEGWAQRGKTMAHSLIGSLRILATFGVTILKDQDSRMLRVALHDMKITSGAKKGTPLTPEQVVTIRVTAREHGFQSIALAQAFQFDTGLRQTDVIGEWVPLDEPGTSEITWEGLKWLRGLRWNEIDENFVLRHTTSMRGKLVEVDLRNKGMVREELQNMYCKRGEPLTREKLPSSGAIIISERNGLPWQAQAFRDRWRELARASDIPDDVTNRNTRAGSRPDVNKVSQTA